MTLIEFFHEHYLLALWAMLFGYGVIIGTVTAISKLINRILRTIKVCVRGWPTGNLDADGDIILPVLPQEDS